MWVRSEYAGELAVLSAWLSVFLPWSVSDLKLQELGSMLFVRFPLLQVQYVYLRIDTSQLSQAGVEVIDRVWVSDPLNAAEFYATGSSATAHTVWLAGAAVIGLAVLLSLAMYFREEAVMDGPVDPVRLMGGLLGGGALLLTASSYLFWTSSPGYTIPVGVFVMYFLAYSLLVVDRVPAGGAGSEVDPDAGTE